MAPICGHLHLLEPLPLKTSKTSSKIVKRTLTSLSQLSRGRNFWPNKLGQKFSPSRQTLLHGHGGESTDRNAAARFLTQATYGTTEAEILAVQSLGYNGWIDQQFTIPKSSLYTEVYATRNISNPNNNTYTGSQLFNAWWKQSVTGPDQLRQRIAFALSQIFVAASEAGTLDEKANALSDYYDMLLDRSFGNVRDLLEDVTLHPTMGRYLDMLKNERPDKASGRIPNENYAREVLQL